jgi:hypothetical protein
MAMSTSSINNLSGSYLQSILGTAFQDAGLTSVKINDASSTSLQPDKSRLSTFAQLMSTLQQLQQTDPAKYQQVTQQIATNLQNAAQTAQADGNTSAATQLNKLAADFSNASQSGQLPNMQDLAKAVGGHHHHGHHHAQAASTDPDNSSSSTTSQALSQLMSAFQTNATQNDAFNPTSIIMNTLSSAGITSSNS